MTRVSNRAAATFNTEQLGCAVLPTSAVLTPARTSCLLLNSVEVPALRFKDVDVQVGNKNVACAQPLGRVLARIRAAAGVCGFVAASMRQRKSPVAAADGRELGRKINEPMRDEVDDLALPLNAATHCDHAGAHHDAAEFLKHLGPDHQVGDPGLVF